MATPLSLAELVGRHAALEALREQIRRLARVPEGDRLPAVLVLGETGTGKGLVAGLLHRSSRRAAGPFIDVNCAAIPDALLESELFGFERGTFTDARAPKPGLVEAAHRGTLFLDEVGDLPDALQVKLLTAIESRQIRRLGSTQSQAVDAWIVAATSIDLTAAMHAGRFRRELYYRLSTVVLQLPPLRTLGRDIGDIANHLLSRATRAHGVADRRLSDDAYAALLAYPWPGNVRELANVLERIVLLDDSPVITASMLALPAAEGGAQNGPSALLSLTAHRAEERQRLVDALNAARGNITRAAARLGVHRNTLRYHLAKHDLIPRDVAPEVPTEPVDAVNGPPAATSAGGKWIRWEHRLVAVLGATLAASVAANAIDLAPVMTDLIELATSFGARIEQLATSELVAVFGIDSMEDAARRAVLAAQAMLQSLLRLDDTPHVRFAVHVGSYLVARAGPVIGLDAHARREATDIVNGLLQQARSDEIVVDAAAARLLDHRFAMEPVGGGSMVPARIVGRERSRFDLGGRPLSPLVDRAADLERLDELARAILGGHGQILGVVGQPGVGKSRLVFELTHSVGVAHWLVLEGGAVPYGTATSYLPIIGLLRSYFHITDQDTQRDIRERVTGKLLTLDRTLEPALPAIFALLDVPVDDPRWQRLDPARRRERTLDAVRRVLLREAKDRPLLVIIEDLHWVDTETQAFLDDFVERVPAAPVLLLVTYRPEYRHAWAARTSYTELRIEPLAPAATGELLDALLGRDASLDRLKLLLGEATERNPLFIEESVRTLIESQALLGAAGDFRLVQPIDAIRVPATVQALLAARIDRLADDDKRLLETAAVIGQDVPLALLRRLTGDDEPTLGERLRRLESGEFLFETGAAPDIQYAFKHTLTHEVAYDSVAVDRRRALHVRIVGALEALHRDRLGEQIEWLAHHAVRAELPDKAVHYLRQAALKAAARSALTEARTWFEQALSMLELRAESQISLGDGFDIRLELRPVLNLLGEARENLERLREAELLAERLDDDERRSRVWAVLAGHLALTGDLESALTTGRRAIQIAVSRSDLRLRLPATSTVAQAHYYRGDYARAVDLAIENLATSPAEWSHEHFGQSAAVSVGDRFWIVQGLAYLGRFVEAAEYDARAHEHMGTTSHAFAIGQVHLAGATLHLVKGEWANARSLLERGLTVVRAGSVANHLGRMLASSAWVLAELEETDEAVDRLREGEALIQRLAAKGLIGHLAWSFPLLGRACLRLGRVDAARRLAERTIESAQGYHGFVAQAWHLLGDVARQSDALRPHKTAAEHYRTALALAEPRGMRPLVAHCHLGLGQLYHRVDRSQDAQTHVAEAARMYREMGMTFWLERAVLSSV
jgi:transcriptional regulator with AAA-type ATPase domain/tetratricopeptide (TPR) repeat protein